MIHIQTTLAIIKDIIEIDYFSYNRAKVVITLIWTSLVSCESNGPCQAETNLCQTCFSVQQLLLLHNHPHAKSFSM